MDGPWPKLQRVLVLSDVSNWYTVLVGVVVRAVVESDRARWAELYRGYAAFYEVTPPDLDHLWRRITELGDLECFVAELDGAVVGLAHVRAFARPLEGDWGGFLDDLFVDPAGRGSGAGAALLEHLRGLARERGWGVVTWITAGDNQVARRLYDRLAEALSLIHISEPTRPY